MKEINDLVQEFDDRIELSAERLYEQFGKEMCIRDRNIAAVKHGIIEYVYAIRDTLRKIYDTELMQGDVYKRQEISIQLQGALQGERRPWIYHQLCDTACNRKSVWMLRKTGFNIFPMAAWVYSRLRGN